jgi:DNA/RNA endonuclease YhcR with UshA esterase domain
MKKFSFLIALTALLAIGMVSCVDQMFDEPPVTDLPQLKGNTTIDVLKKKHILGATASKITEDLIIEGIVVADDRSGNFFENIVIQDATGGISVRMNASGLYNTFPIGTKVAVRCKNLYIGDYNGVHQLNGSVTDAIEELLIPQHVFATAKDQPVTPKVLGIKDLNQTHINTLIKLENVEFAPADTNQTWADAVKLFSVNRNLQDCSGGTVIVRSSGYADFAKDKTPGKKGSLTAIYTVFGSTKQLIIRDPRDAAMTGVRCGGAGTGGGGQLMSIADLRALHKGTTLTIPADKKIKGVVISDKAAGNTDPRNAVIQDGAAGVVVRFKNNHDLSLGQEVEVTVSGQELSEFNGLLQVNNIDNGLAKINGAGQLPTPRVTSAAQIAANLNTWESTLVKITKGTFSASGTYSGSKTLTDSTGQVVVFTRSQATFAGSALPVGKNLDLVGIVSQFNTAQITPRNLNDIVVTGGGGGGPSADNLLDESFSSGTVNQPAKPTGWVSKSVTGTRTWLTKSFSGNFFAEATAFQSTDTENEMWLITPGIKAADAKTLTFESAQAFYKHDGLTVYISNDFDGTNIDKATWKKLTYKMPTSKDANYDWVQSGNIDVSGYSGTIYIGFQHKGDKTTNTTTFRLDNVKVGK